MEKTSLKISEDWLSFWLGLVIFVLSLGAFFNIDILGWGVKVNTWNELNQILAPVSSSFSWMPGWLSVIATYVFLLIILGFGSWALGANIKKFLYSFTIVFIIGFVCYVLGNYANIAATTSKEMDKFGIKWSLMLTGEAGFIIALIVGLIIGNFFPKFANSLKEAIRPELFVKTAIVIMGAGVGIKAIENASLSVTILFLGLCAIIVAYLVYWAFVYYIARRFFKFSKEWAAPLASGISICGVSAAIATGGAIRARPIVPIMVSSLVVIFAVVELLLLPFLAQQFLWHEPLVSGAWMGLAVKTDGAATASGAITDALVLAKLKLETGLDYEKDWILNTATNVKVFIDVFIGIWAFILAIIWTKYFDKKQGEKVKVIEIWQRFPKFVIGYLLTFLIFLVIGLASPSLVKTKVETKQNVQETMQSRTNAKENIDTLAQHSSTVQTPEKSRIVYKSGPAKSATEQGNVFRIIFFVLTFFTIGVMSNFKKLMKEGIGKLALIYIIALFGFIIWIALLISYLFFGGIMPPLSTI